MNYNKNIFNHKNQYTIGVEEEYMICDPSSGNLINKADEILDYANNSLKKRLSYELICSEIESNTSICSNSNEAIEQVSYLRSKLKEIGQKLDFKIGISGTHPTASPLDQKFVNTEGYNWVADQLNYYAKNNITFALHIHVAVPNSELSIKAVNALRRWIPPLLALSTNSPFFNGIQTGMRSSRTFQFGSFPRTNIPEKFNSYEHFLSIVNSFVETKTIEKPRQIWWKIRPHLDYGTIEFRMIDVQRSLKKTHMFIALLQALTHKTIEDSLADNLNENLSLEILNDGLWKASRFNFDCLLIDSSDNENLSMHTFVNKMMNYCEESLAYFNNQDIIDDVNDILINGSECDDQIQIYENNGMNSLKKYLMNNVSYKL
tara:strand:+ start:148 stop:1272 length:1125 start_codon:yes stop_codon:yes gene_type:complete